MGNTDQDPLIGQILHETYRIERKLAEGGMGAIYEASHVRLPKKRFAVKLLLGDVADKPDIFARFRREAEIATELGHPNIVDVLDFHETTEGQPYIVMELLDGEDLGARLRRSGTLEPAWLARLMTQVGSALQAAHSKGIVHRDMKPENIFLVSGGAVEPMAKVLDFGISKIKHSKSVVTQANAVFGTPYYMSPEQAVGNVADIDAATDIFALGTICYQALSGAAPFEAPTVPGIIYKVCHEYPVPISTVVPGLPPALDPVLNRALAKDKAERYQRVDEFVADLEAAISNRPVIPATIGPGVRPERGPTPLEATADRSIAPTAPGWPAEPELRRPAGPSASPQKPRTPVVIAVVATVLVGLVVAALALRGTGTTTVETTAVGPEPPGIPGATGALAVPDAEARLTFQKMHAAAWKQIRRGASADAAGRGFKGAAVDMDVTVGERLAGLCTFCFGLHFPRVRNRPANPRDLSNPVVTLDRSRPLNPLAFIAHPGEGLDAIRFGIFAERMKGKDIHIRGTIGGTQDWPNYSPLVVHVMSYGPGGRRMVTTESGAAAVSEIPHKGERALVNLLRLPGASVSVSSQVNNSVDLPDHLVDGNLQTAWNSKTGQLEGSWIAFSVPAEAHVSLIRLTVGYTGRKRGKDLFSMNHRIARVKITRDGVVLKEPALDTEDRNLQEIPIDSPGGAYKVEVLKTVTGTKPRWQETCVSEFQVLGIAPTGTGLLPRPPKVGVAGSDSE